MAFSLSFNPVWSMVDLTGLQLDDTYYLFTLDNLFPYGKINLYKDQSATVPWSDPIQFLANGTLPYNMYWNESLVYRLEVRKGPTQSDPLIYLVENYVPNTEAPGPVVSNNSTTNQVSNPQFSQIVFSSPTLVSTSNLTDIAPGWQVVTTGSGTITVSQLTFAGDEGIPGNPSYGISIENLGFTSVTLQQKFDHNGALWTGQAVSVDVSAKALDGNPTLSAVVKWSDGTNKTVFAQALNSGWQAYMSAVAIEQSANTDTPDVAYTLLDLSWTGNVTVQLTSIQLLGQVEPDNTVVYEQITLERQIDQLYHLAYPVVPVGTVIDFAGFAAPRHYLLCDGTNTYSRSTYLQLFNALTLKSTVTLASSTTYTDANAPKLSIGTYVEGTGIPAATTITVISGTTVTISNAATVSSSETLTYFPYGAGSTADNFAVPNLQGKVIAGAGGTPLNLDTVTPNTLGESLGSAATTLIAANLPPHTHTVSSTYDTTTTGAANVIALGQTPRGTYNSFSVGDGPGLSSSFTNVQPTTVLYKYIRYE